MGLDINSLNFLGFSKNQGVDFSKTLSVGRASVCMSDDDIREFLIAFGRSDLAKDIPQLTHSKYFEEILSAVFGANELDSIDASGYEGASIIHSLNEPLKTDKRFTAIIDFGCLEHVFNFPVAIDNLINLCEVNGHILHYLPANNCCGHGFYQFSPELFFSLYTEQRGFANTQVFFVEWQDDPTVWFEIKSPIELHKRVNIANTCEGYLLVKTTKLANAVSPMREPPQQSDYLAAWDGASDPLSKKGSKPAKLLKLLKVVVKKLLPIMGIEKQGWRIAERYAYKKKLVRSKRSDLTRLKVADLIKGQ